MSRRLLAVLAVSSLLVATGCDSLSERIHMAQGNKLYKAQKYEEAIKEYKAILSSDPQNFNANYLVAMSNLAMYHPGSTHPKDVGFAKESLEHFEKLLKMTPPGNAAAQKEQHEKLQKYYLSLLTAAGQDDKAVTFLEAERDKNPNNVGIMQSLATYYAKKDFNKALGAFEKIAEMEPKNKEHWYTLGVVCWERSYKGGIAVSDEEREKLIDKGQAALSKALAIDSGYFEALSYVNLLHREMAKVCSNRQDADCYQREMKAADEAKDKAVALLKARKEAEKNKPQTAAPPKAAK